MSQSNHLAASPPPNSVRDSPVGGVMWMAIWLEPGLSWSPMVTFTGASPPVTGGKGWLFTDMVAFHHSPSNRKTDADPSHSGGNSMVVSKSNGESACAAVQPFAPMDGVQVPVRATRIRCDSERASSGGVPHPISHSNSRFRSVGMVCSV